VLFLAALLRVRSFNALEPELRRPRLLAAAGRGPEATLSADTISRSLRCMDVESCRRALVTVLRRAERNKVFREGWFGGLRMVAIDGWEPFSSRSRHCPACLSREVSVGGRVEVEYFHRFAVAMLVGPGAEVVLDMEECRCEDLRHECGDKADGHEGELTAAKRLLRRLKETYGRLLDVVVADALYANGPFLTLVRELELSAVVVLKNEKQEPLKEAMLLTEQTPPDLRREGHVRGETLDIWDVRELETLETFDGSIRVVRARVHRAAAPPGTWCFGVVGPAARKLSARRVVEVGRSRWHIENTAFHQWTTRWNMGHVFTHGPQATPALLLIFCLAYDLLEIYTVRQLPQYARGNGDVTRTLVRLCAEMRDDLARLEAVVDWRPG